MKKKHEISKKTYLNDNQLAHAINKAKAEKKKTGNKQIAQAMALKYKLYEETKKKIVIN